MPARRLAVCLILACWLASPAQASAEELPVAVVEYAAATADRVAPGVDVGHTAPELAGTAVPASELEVGVEGEGGVAPVQGQAGAALPDAGSSADPLEEPTEPTPPAGPLSAPPTGEPIAQPTDEPIAQPTGKSSAEPTGESSPEPTGQPSAQSQAPAVPDAPEESAALEEQAAGDETAALVATPPEAGAPAPGHLPEPAAPVLPTGPAPAQSDEPEVESSPVREPGAPEGPAFDAPIFAPSSPPAASPSASRDTPAAYASTTAPKVRESAPERNRRGSRARGTGRQSAPAIPHRSGTHGAASAGASAGGGTTSPNVAALPGVAAIALQGPVARLRFSRPSWRLVSVAEPPERPG